MLLGWFRSGRATELGAALADQYPLLSGGSPLRARQLSAHERAVREHLERATREMRALRLNFYKRARFANSFKWRLLERGVDPSTADQATQTLVVSLALRPVSAEELPEASSAAGEVSRKADARTLQTQADEALARGATDEAVTYYEQLRALKPGRIEILCKLADALVRLGRYAEAEKHYRAVIGREPGHANAHGSLGAIHLARGSLEEAENSLRRALSLQSTNIDHRSNLGLTLVGLGRLDRAQAQLEKVLRGAPRHANALYGLGLIARAQGRFEDADSFFRRAIEADPNMVRAWADLAGMRKMSATDREWLRKAQELAALSVPAHEQAHLHFAMGKYYDDVEQFAEAFRCYERANTLLKGITAPYQRELRTSAVEDLMRVYQPETIARVGAGGSSSARPVFIVGMARSGTSLAEQIVAAHPEAATAGELDFWNAAMRRHEPSVRSELLDEGTRTQLAADYLRTLNAASGEAARVIDKAPVNCDYLGVIFSVFPKSRIIYMRRDPIDTCLSCYFQPFSAALNHTLDLSDLAHYYREHQRLMAHWRAVLPADSLLEVPYEELVADQEKWTRRMLDFLGLPWHAQCLEFYRTERPVLTSSFWQVRQRIYNNSVRRARHYRKFIAPLLELKP